MAASTTRKSSTHPATNKYDVAMAKALGRAKNIEQLVSGVKLVVVLAFIRWYLGPVDDMVHAIAGRDTNFQFSASVQITIAITIAVTATGIATVTRKMRRQGQDLRRLRERLQELDHDLLV